MAYLRLYNPTTDSCDFKVRLSNSFNTRYYKRLRITKTNYGDSTSSVGSYLEDRTASSSSSASEYVRGVVNEGLHEGRTYTLYAYAQARNSTWYLAGSDDITMEDDGSKEYDYEIESIKPNKSEPFKFGDGVEFEVEVYNCKRSRGPKYKVLLKDRRGNTIAYDDEPYLDGKETNSAYLATTIKKSDVVDGKAKFTFVVESRESGYEEVWPKDNTEVVEYEVRDNTPLSLGTDGENLIKKHEGFCLKFYGDPYGYPTVGWGHLITKSRKYNENTTGNPEDSILTQAQADALSRDLNLSYTSPISRTYAQTLFDNDTESAVEEVNNLKPPQNCEFSQSQFDALVSLTFNCGPGVLETNDVEAMIASPYIYENFGQLTPDQSDTCSRLVSKAFSYDRNLQPRRNSEATLFCKGQQYSHKYPVYTL